MTSNNSNNRARVPPPPAGAPVHWWGPVFSDEGRPYWYNTAGRTTYINPHVLATAPLPPGQQALPHFQAPSQAPLAVSKCHYCIESHPEGDDNCWALHPHKNPK